MKADAEIKLLNNLITKLEDKSMENIDLFIRREAGGSHISLNKKEKKLILKTLHGVLSGDAANGPCNSDKASSDAVLVASLESALLERIAKAIFAASMNIEYREVIHIIEANWHKFSPELKERCLIPARAAIISFALLCDKMYGGKHD